jgi:hypothetical protein
MAKTSNKVADADEITGGAVADGEYLQRSGSDVVGGTPSGGGGVITVPFWFNNAAAVDSVTYFSWDDSATNQIFGNAQLYTGVGTSIPAWTDGEVKGNLHPLVPVACTLTDVACWVRHPDGSSSVITEDVVVYQWAVVDDATPTGSTAGTISLDGTVGYGSNNNLKDYSLSSLSVSFGAGDRVQIFRKNATNPEPYQMSMCLYFTVD